MLSLELTNPSGLKGAAIRYPAWKWGAGGGQHALLFGVGLKVNFSVKKSFLYNFAIEVPDICVAILENDFFSVYVSFQLCKYG